MSKGIIVAGFGAIGKTTLGNKYDNIIDMESGYYRWDNTGFENIPYEQRKGKKERPENIEWPDNYYKAIIEAIKKYHPKELLRIQKSEYLEDVLKNKGII